MAELWENAQQGAKVKGGSSVRNRALELLGKELGMFQDKEAKPLNVEDLTTAPGGDVPKPPPESLQ